MRKLVLAFLAAGALLSAPVGAHAYADDAQARLAHGDTLTYPQTIENGDHRYVGGVTYSIVNASSSELRALFEDVRAYKELLPHTRSARLVGANGPDLFIELRQGNAIVQTSYTLRIRREPDGRTVRFWLDTTKPHGIADAWGYFRITELPDAAPGSPRVLLSYGALVDVGPGLVRELFEERVRAAMLEVPSAVQRYALAHLRAHPRA